MIHQISKIKSLFSLNAFQLRSLALILMLMGHMAAIFFPYFRPVRIIGRMSFVIYSFLVVEGFMHARSLQKYLHRLILFALISEIPFDLAFSGVWYNPFRQNVFFTLAAGLLALIIIESKKVSSDVKVLLIACLVTAANMFYFDYYYLGVLQVIFFYIFRSNWVKKILTIGILNIFFMGRISTQAAGILGFIPIYFYNGERGKKSGILFYLLYPLHLLVYWIVKRYIMG